MLKFPKILSDGCVLQRGEKCRIWGFGTPGAKICVSIRRCAEKGTGCPDAGEEERTYDTIADADGNFEVQALKLQPGGPYELCAKNQGGEEALTRSVYVGDVYVCSGQSNMELPMTRVRVKFPEEFEDGGSPDVHIYKVTEHYDFCAPRKDHAAAEWSVCDREHLADLSAFSYFFGKKLSELYKIPIGIINLSLGGTPAEAWMSREALEAWPDLLALADRHRDEKFCRDLTARAALAERAWYNEIERQEKQSADAPFHPACLPGNLRDWGLENFCGCIRLRRSFEVPSGCAGREALLRFGTLADSDKIFLNGVLIGETGYRYPPRRYPVPAGLLKAGKNEIEIRLVCREGDGRITDGKPLDITWKDGSVPLAGRWEYQVRAVCSRAPEQIFINRVPTGLFHGMVAPCLPYSVKGVVWYQGESNDCRPQTYAALLKSLILDWRRQWRQDRLPFVVVQLPNCDIDIAPGDAWPQIREAQYQAGRLEDTAVTVNLDLGEDNDLHPLDKKTAAERAVLAVRALIYQENIAWHGPELQDWEREEGAVRLRFCGLGDGLRLSAKSSDRTEKAKERLFELAGKDGVYYPASAEVRGWEIRLHSGQAEQPCCVRYAWMRAPGPVLLRDASGLCAAPFRLCLTQKESRDGGENEAV